MPIDENDNLYVLEEEEPIETDESPLNFAAYEDDERMDEDDEAVSAGPRSSAFGALFRIMLNPVEGWKRLRRDNISSDTIQSGCFYPLLAVLAVSKFANFFYSVNVSFQQVVTEAIFAFVAYFFSYFCIRMVVAWLLPKEVSKGFEDKFGKEYVLISLSSLVLFSILTDLLPMIWPILIFLPVWTIYIMFKGVRFFKMPVKYEMKFLVVMVTATIGMPLLIDWLLNSILEL